MKKLVDVDDEIWRRFGRSCRLEGIRIGCKLCDLIDGYLETEKRKTRRNKK